MNRSALISLVAGALSGGLLVLAMPRADLGYLAYFWLVPGFSLAHDRAPRHIVLIGAAAGIVSAIGKVYWIAETLVNYGGLSYAVGTFTTVLLALYLSGYTLLFFMLVARFHPASPSFPWVCAATWVTLEWLQGHLLTGFPWMLLGYTQHNVLPILQSARIWGVYGIGFLVMLANGSIVYLQAAGRSAWKGVAAPALLLLATLTFGYGRLSHVPPEQHIKIGMVQGSIPQGEKWQKDFREDTVDRYEVLTRQLAETGVDFVVLPETALPFDFRGPENARYFSRMIDLTRGMGIPVLVGSLQYEGEKIYNRAFLISPEGEVAGHQDKVHLVPFGEYLPIEWIFGYMEGLTRESGRFTPGIAHRALRLPGKQVSFGVSVCYESIFPEIARAYALDGAEFLVNLTNDAWFGATAAPYQHFTMGVFRAVENGIPLIRCANTGISGAVDPCGRVLIATNIFEPAVITARIAPRRERTFYTRHGDLLVALCALVTVWSLAGNRSAWR